MLSTWSISARVFAVNPEKGVWIPAGVVRKTYNFELPRNTRQLNYQFDRF